MGKLVMPGKKRKCKQTVIEKLNEITKMLFIRKCMPSFLKIVIYLSKLLLLSLGFEFITRNKNSVVIDRDNVIL